MCTCFNYSMFRMFVSPHDVLIAWFNVLSCISVLHLSDMDGIQRLTIHVYVTVNLCNQGIREIPREFAKSLKGLVNSQIP